MEKDIIFVTATREHHTAFLDKKPFGIFVEKANYHKKVKIIQNNSLGLTKVYNSFINKNYEGKYIIFIHDDVLIDDLFFYEKISLAFDKYSIIGLAGSKTCDLEKPPAWHLMTDRDNMVGEVKHSNNGRVWTSVFGPTDSRALIIDGLFIGVDVNILLQNDLRFDENFDFHHYDISFCLRANQKKVKVGVFPLTVTHFGLGDSMNSQNWINSSEKFKKLYCNG